MAPAIELTYDAWMGRALELAREVGAAGDVPVGALVVDPDGEVIGVGANLAGPAVLVSFLVAGLVCACAALWAFAAASA